MGATFCWSTGINGNKNTPVKMSNSKMGWLLENELKMCSESNQPSSLFFQEPLRFLDFPPCFAWFLGIEAIHVNGVEMVSRTRGWRKRLTKSRSPIEKLTRWLKRFAMNLNFWVVCYAFPKKGLQVVGKIALVMFMRGTFTANPICRDGSWIHPGLIPPNPMGLKNLYLPSSPNQQPF